MSITCTVIAAVALAAMWVRSHRVADSIGYGQRFTASDGGYRTGVGSVRSSRGVVYFGAGYFLPIFLASGPAREGVFHEHDASPAEVRPPPAWSLLGFSFRRIDAG